MQSLKKIALLTFVFAACVSCEQEIQAPNYDGMWVVDMEHADRSMGQEVLKILKGNDPNLIVEAPLIMAMLYGTTLTINNRKMVINTSSAALGENYEERELAIDNLRQMGMFDSDDISIDVPKPGRSIYKLENPSISPTKVFNEWRKQSHTIKFENKGGFSKHEELTLTPLPEYLMKRNKVEFQLELAFIRE